MVDQDTLVCETCNTLYALTLPHCPNCGEANPLITEGLLAEDIELESERRRHWLRSRSGCLIIFLFLLFFSLVVGGIVLGGYEGLQDRVANTRAEVDKHYQKALVHIENDRLELAIAELELTLSLDPIHTEARETLEILRLRETVEITPTPTFEVLVTTITADDLFDDAKSQTQQGNWVEVIEILKQIRDIDPGYKVDEVSNTLYNANYELGLRLVLDGRLREAVIAFDEALAERPDDPSVTEEWEKVTLYLSLNPATSENFEDNIVVLNRIYSQDADFVDVANLLYETYKQYGDYLGSQDEWCLALPRYQDAAAIFSRRSIETLVSETEIKCENERLAKIPPTPTATPVPSPTPTAVFSDGLVVAATKSITQPVSGTIYFSRFNQESDLWEIIAHSLADGSEKVVLGYADQPAVSYDDKLLVYRSLINNRLGLHVFNLNTGEDTHVTIFAEDLLPNWNHNNQDFVFTSQRAGDRRWQILIGFADGKGEAIVLLDGRTPTSSAIDDMLAFQGTDPQGNNPGIYTVSRAGGEPQRMSTDESDRNPAFSPLDNHIAFMSTQNGNWDIWTVPSTGGDPQPLTTSSANDGLPVWSPDGSHIAFVSDRNGRWGIYTINASGGEPKRIADWGSEHSDWLLARLSWGR